MFASLAVGVDREWMPTAEQWAQLRGDDGECTDFALPAKDSPGATSALVYETADIGSQSDDELIDSIVGLGKLASWAQAKQSAAIAELAKRRPPAWLHDDGIDDYPAVSQYVAEEIACALSLTVRGAENRLDLALRLDDALPETRLAWERGDLDWSQVTVIVDRTTVLTAEQARHIEREFIAKSIGKTRGQIRRIVDRAVIAADPDAANERHESARLRRDVVTRPIEDGMAQLTATLSVEEAALAETVLTRHAESKPRDDPRTMGQRRADALMALITGSRSEAITASPPLPTLLAGTKPLIQVVVAADTIAGDNENPAELDGYGPIPAELARRLAADATWRRILTDPESGAVLDVGRTRYRPPRALVDYVTSRERVCGFPPCGRNAKYCQIDHAVPFEKGGRTSPDNTGPLCTRHHLLKTHTGWTITRSPDGTVTWTSPTGHKYKNYPSDYGVYLNAS